ncbi:MAG: RnfABCDGE type electron transport complex subunit G [Spirochaetes bacterium]|nr:RnfABCDGE type electron transport complex subunit G [Spirochaetota bacterium]
MKDIFKMLVVLTLICAVCGLLLAFVREQTKDKIEEQVLLNVKGPAVSKVLQGSENDLIKDRRTIKIDGKEMVVFIGKKENTPWAFAFETSAGGFGGDIGVITGFSLEKNELTGIGITTHKETPGLGSRVTEDSFSMGFKDKPLTSEFKVKADGGVIDAISGATISSRGVCTAVRNAVAVSKEVKNGIK